MKALGQQHAMNIPSNHGRRRSNPYSGGTRRRARGSSAPEDDIVEALFGAPGVQAREIHAVLVIEPEGELAWAAKAEAASRRVVRATGGSVEAKWFQEKVVVAVSAARRGPAESRHLKSVGGAIAEALAGLPPYRRQWMGVGSLLRGETGVRSSYQEALDALRIGQLLNGQPSVVSFEEILPYRVVAADRGLVLRLAAVLSPIISYERTPGRPNILPVLESFYESGSAETAARKLGLHRHTIAYRLTVAERLLGHSVRHGPDRLLIQMALVAQRLLATEGRP